MYIYKYIIYVYIYIIHNTYQMDIEEKRTSAHTHTNTPTYLSYRLLEQILPTPAYKPTKFYKKIATLSNKHFNSTILQTCTTPHILVIYKNNSIYTYVYIYIFYMHICIHTHSHTHIHI